MHHLPPPSNPLQQMHHHSAMQQQQQQQRTRAAARALPLPPHHQHQQQQQQQQQQHQQQQQSIFNTPESDPLNAFDVDVATFQLAGTRIDETDPAPSSSEQPRQHQHQHQHQQPARALHVSLLASPSQEIMPSNMTLSDSLSNGLDVHASQLASDAAKNQRKQLADDIDKVLNSAGMSVGLPNHCTISPPSTANQHMFDALSRPNNGKNSASVSRSVSFMLKNNAPFASRENSMDFRKGEFGAKRDMSMDMIRRDISMDLLSSRRIGSQERIDSELVRDMSIEFFGSSLRNANRDFSMEMQFPADSGGAQSGAMFELGALADDVVFGQAFLALPTPSKPDFGAAADARDGRLPRSRTGMSQDDLMVHVLANQGPHQQYRRNVNGSVEDLRELKMPF
ncbi:unnamed protein product [Agarophyton chilense]